MVSPNKYTIMNLPSIAALKSNYIAIIFIVCVLVLLYIKFGQRKSKSQPIINKKIESTKTEPAEQTKPRYDVYNEIASFMNKQAAYVMR